MRTKSGASSSSTRRMPAARRSAAPSDSSRGPSTARTTSPSTTTTTATSTGTTNEGAGVDFPRLSGQRRTQLAEATERYSAALEGSAAEEYLESRGIPVDVAERF